MGVRCVLDLPPLVTKLGLNVLTWWPCTCSMGSVQPLVLLYGACGHLQC